MLFLDVKKKFNFCALLLAVFVTAWEDFTLHLRVFVKRAKAGEEWLPNKAPYVLSTHVQPAGEVVLRL